MTSRWAWASSAVRMATSRFQLPGVVLDAVAVRFVDQDVSQTHLKLDGVHGLAEKLGGPRPQRGQLRLPVAGRGENDDGEVKGLLAAAQLRENVQAADAGHHDVQKHDVGLFRTDEVQRLGRIGGRGKLLVAGQLEILLHDLDVDRLVIDDHDVRIGDHLIRRGPLEHRLNVEPGGPEQDPHGPDLVGNRTAALRRQAH